MCIAGFVRPNSRRDGPRGSPAKSYRPVEKRGSGTGGIAKTEDAPRGGAFFTRPVSFTPRDGRSAGPGRGSEPGAAFGADSSTGSARFTATTGRGARSRRPFARPRIRVTDSTVGLSRDPLTEVTLARGYRRIAKAVESTLDALTGRSLGETRCRRLRRIGAGFPREDDPVRYIVRPWNGRTRGGSLRGRHVRSTCRRSVRPAIHVPSRGSPRSSSTGEPSDPPFGALDCTETYASRGARGYFLFTTSLSGPHAPASLSLSLAEGRRSPRPILQRSSLTPPRVWCISSGVRTAARA